MAERSQLTPSPLRVSSAEVSSFLQSYVSFPGAAHTQQLVNVPNARAALQGHPSSRDFLGVCRSLCCDSFSQASLLNSASLGSHKC